jgi:hypothetical protein
MNVGEFLDQLCDYQILNKGFEPWITEYGIILCFCVRFFRSLMGLTFRRHYGRRSYKHYKIQAYMTNIAFYGMLFRIL